MAIEAKKLGFRAWEVAKSMMDGAVKGAKEAMKKRINSPLFLRIKPLVYT